MWPAPGPIKIQIPLMITRHLQIKWLSGNVKMDTSGNPELLTEPEGMDALIVLEEKSLRFLQGLD